MINFYCAKKKNVHATKQNKKKKAQPYILNSGIEIS